MNVYLIGKSTLSDSTNPRYLPLSLFTNTLIYEAFFLRLRGIFPTFFQKFQTVSNAVLKSGLPQTAADSRRQPQTAADCRRQSQIVTAYRKNYVEMPHNRSPRAIIRYMAYSLSFV